MRGVHLHFKTYYMLLIIILLCTPANIQLDFGQYWLLLLNKQHAAGFHIVKFSITRWVHNKFLFLLLLTLAVFESTLNNPLKKTKKYSNAKFTVSI